MDESDDTTVTEDADFSLILNGAELELASYTYASEDGWLELLVVLLADVSDLVDVGEAAVAVVVVLLFKVLAVVFVVLELAMTVVSMLDGELMGGRINTSKKRATCYLPWYVLR